LLFSGGKSGGTFWKTFFKWLMYIGLGILGLALIYAIYFFATKESDGAGSYKIST